MANSYTESSVVKQYRKKLQNAEETQPQEFSGGSYSALASAALQKLGDTSTFTYEPKADPLYRQIRQLAKETAERAMKDTIGKATAKTGGYLNSYAETAGQQIYAEGLKKADDQIPALYKLAYEKYQDEKKALSDQYKRYTDANRLEYDIYKDRTERALNEKKYLADRLDAEKDDDYRQYMDAANLNYKIERDEKNLAYKEARDRITDAYRESGNTGTGGKSSIILTPDDLNNMISRIDFYINEGLIPKARSLTAMYVAQGYMTKEQANAIFEEYGLNR